MSEFGVVLFYTTSSALRAEKVTRNAGLKVKLIPTPREFSSDCGMALRFLWSDEKEMRAVLAAARVELSEVRQMG
jgi:hypothetical protein